MSLDAIAEVLPCHVYTRRPILVDALKSIITDHRVLEEVSWQLQEKLIAF